MTTWIRWAAIAFVAIGCEFNSGGVSSDGGGNPLPADARVDDANVPDASPDQVFEDVVHVPPAAEFGGFTDLVLDTSVVIDTDNLQIGGRDVPDGATFAVSPQSGGGPDLAILHVKSLTIANSTKIAVVGARPFVVIASGAIVIEGVIEGGASHGRPGPGGAAPGEGDGSGGAGEHTGTFRDSGGGGASFGSAGGVGGDASCSPACGDDGPAEGGIPGSTYGDDALTQLVGGSGGGASSPVCPSDPAGAGGGALQFYSGTSITIAADAGINAGGGGGGAGKVCTMQTGSASGGGSGGAIFLQAPAITCAGTLSANGGGGGSSAGLFNMNMLVPGEAGGDGVFGSSSASGGALTGDYSQDGGDGASGLSAAQAGVSDLEDFGNGGGGGGGTGRISLLHHAGGLDSADSSASPVPVANTY